MPQTESQGLSQAREVFWAKSNLPTCWQSVHTRQGRESHGACWASVCACRRDLIILPHYPSCPTAPHCPSPGPLPPRGPPSLQHGWCTQKDKRRVRRMAFVNCIPADCTQTALRQAVAICAPDQPAHPHSGWWLRRGRRAWPPSLEPHTAGAGKPAEGRHMRSPQGSSVGGHRRLLPAAAAAQPVAAAACGLQLPR